MKNRGDTSKISNHHYSLPLCPPVIISLMSWHVCTSSSSTHRHTHSCFAYFQIFRKESNQVHRDHHRDSSRLLPQEAPRADAVVRVHEAWDRGAGQFSVTVNRIRRCEHSGMRRVIEILSFRVFFAFFRGHFMRLRRATLLRSFFRYWSSWLLFRCLNSKLTEKWTGDFLKKFYVGYKLPPPKVADFSTKM